MKKIALFWVVVAVLSIAITVAIFAPTDHIFYSRGTYTVISTNLGPNKVLAQGDAFFSGLLAETPYPEVSATGPLKIGQKVVISTTWKGFNLLSSRAIPVELVPPR